MTCFMLQVERDGSYQIVDFPLLGGRFLQGFSAICCGAKVMGAFRARLQHASALTLR